MGTIFTPAGSPGWISAIRAFTRLMRGAAPPRPPGLHAIDDVQRVLALPHHHNARDHLTLAVQVGYAAADIGPQDHVANVLNANRRAVFARRNHDVLYVADGFRVTAAAHHVLRAAEFHHPPTGLFAAAADGLRYL